MRKSRRKGLLRCEGVKVKSEKSSGRDGSICSSAFRQPEGFTNSQKAIWSGVEEKKPKLRGDSAVRLMVQGLAGDDMAGYWPVRSLSTQNPEWTLLRQPAGYCTIFAAKLGQHPLVCKIQSTSAGGKGRGLEEMSSTASSVVSGPKFKLWPKIFKNGEGRP